MNSGWVAYDDVSLTKVQGGIEVPVPNPGFEGTTGWAEVRPSEFPGMSFYRSSWGTAAPHSGSYAYVMSNHPYGRLLSEPVLVHPDTEYDLCAWMRGEINPDDGEGLWLIGAYFYDSDGWYDGFATAASGGAGTLDSTWQQKGGKIRTSSEAATLRVYLYQTMNDGWVAFDDVSLGEVTMKYYYFGPLPGTGAQRVAMRRNGVLQYVAGDHPSAASLAYPAGLPAVAGQAWAARAWC